MPEVSVIICSHNPRGASLRRTLDSIQAQTLDVVHWEFLLIDNGSWRPLAEEWDLSWHPHARHVQETQLGLTPARLRGITEARGELLLFVDDDNVLDPNYLERAWTLALGHPHIGVFGAGALIPEFELEPPIELLPLISMLAIRTVPAPVWSNNRHDVKSYPWGAGLCVKRPIAERYHEVVTGLNTIGILDRRGAQLFCGGDDLFSWVALWEGYGFGLFPELRLTHLIAGQRLNQRYFIQLLHDHAFSHSILRHLLFAEAPSKRTTTQTLRLGLHALRRGIFSMRCRWAEISGADNAARLIAKNNLRPLTAEIALKTHSCDETIRLTPSGADSARRPFVEGAAGESAQ